MKTRKINYIWFAPVITLGILLVLYAIAEIFPFGPNTSAFSDAVGQYIPMLAEMARKIKTGSSLFFTWHANRGSNFLAIISYYLASPLNLIAVFFAEKDIDNAFSIITLLKPVLMSLTFGIYLKHTYKKNDLSVVIFSVLWACSGFIVGAFFFVSWMDSIIYLPLVILGLKNLMDGKSGWFYSLFLGLTIISNFYIGWMVCIFCVIYFIYSFVSDDEVVYEGVSASKEEQPKAEEDTVNIFDAFKNSYLLGSMFRFAFASILAGALSTVLSLPTVYALQETLKGTTNADTLVSTNMWGLLASHIIPFKNIYDTLGSNECIFAFCGIATVVLCTAYFFSKGISVRKKLGNAFLLVAFWASMWLYPIYFTWHGFGEPYGIMYRFAFLYSFVLLKIAYEAFCNIKNIPLYGFLAGLVMCIIDIVGIKQNGLFNAYFSSLSFIAPIVAFALIFTVALILISKGVKPKQITAVLLAVVILETVVLNKDNLNKRNLTSLIAEKNYVDEFSNNISEDEYLAFDKKDTTFSDIAMYGMLFNNNDNSTYSSLANGDFTLSMMYFGCYGNGINAVDGAKEQTPIFNMFFPTKYYLDGSENLSESKFRKEITSNDGYTLYENNYTMPFMYTIPTTIDEWDPFAYISPADDQNAAFKYITALNKDVLSYNKLQDIKYENCVSMSNLDRMEETGAEQDYSNDFYEFLESKMLRFSTKIQDTTKPAYVTINSVAQNDGIMYLFVDVTQFTDLTISINGTERKYSAFGIGENRTYEIGEVKKGDVLSVTLGGYHHDRDANGNVYPTPYEAIGALSYTVDMNVFEEGYKLLDSYSDTELLELSDTHVKAKVNSSIDGYLYIPTGLDYGWTITIDGVKTPLYNHESHILMTEITEGEHIVEMKYVPQGFVPGAVISGVSIVILIAWAVISKKREREMNND